MGDINSEGNVNVQAIDPFGKQILIEIIFCTSSIDPEKALNVFQRLSAKECLGFVYGIMPDHMCESIHMYKKRVPAMGLIKRVKLMKSKNIVR